MDEANSQIKPLKTVEPNGGIAERVSGEEKIIINTNTNNTFGDRGDDIISIKNTLDIDLRTDLKDL